MEQEIWEQVGRDRAPGRVGDELTVGFLGSAYPHKGPQLLVRGRAAHALAVARADPRRGARPHSPQQLQRAGPARRGRAERRVRAERDRPRCSRRRRRRAAVAVVGLRAAGRGRVPRRARAARRAAPRRAARGGPRRGRRPGVRRARRRRPRAPARSAGARAGTARAPAGGDRAAALLLPLHRRARGLLRGGASRRARATPQPPAAPAVRWSGRPRPRRQPVDHQRPGRRAAARSRCSASQRDGSPAAGDPPLPHAADVEVRHQWPPDLRPAPGGRLAVIQPWEFGAIPRRLGRPAA